ncbi:MAG: 3-dehydrosphinganine reductase [Candelina mexicana]|nr:MAG: 3-dehydrosphinganine reductase [Candelina mexicana]
MALGSAAMEFFRRKNFFPVEGRTIIITGGSEGLGRAAAKLLATKGANVVIVARNVQKLEAAIAYISAAAANPKKQRFHYISADMTNPTESARILEEVTAWNNNLPADIVWCNAGSAEPGLFLDMPIDRLRYQMDVNYWSAAYLAQATLKSWLQQTPQSLSRSKSTATSSNTIEPRHLIFTSSVLAFYPIVGYSPYAPAKAAMRSLSDALSQEIKLYHGAYQHDDPLHQPPEVKLHTICPGTIYTPGHEQENKSKPEITKQLEADDPGQSEDECAAASVKALERGDYLITLQWLGDLMRGSAWAGSPRNNRFLDTVVSWITSIIWLFVQPDLDGKVWKYGKANGVPQPS